MPAKQNSGFINNLLILFIAISMFSIVTENYLFVPLITRLSEIYGVTPRTAAQMSSYYSLFYAISLFVWSVISDRAGRKQILLIGMVGMLASTIALTLVNDFKLILIIRCVQASFAGSFPTVMIVWTTENLDIKNRIKAITAISGAFIFSSLLGQIVGDYMVRDNIKNIMYIYSIIYFINFIIILQFKNNRDNIKPKEKISQIGYKVLRIFKNKRILTYYISSLFLLSSIVILYSSLGTLFLSNLESIDITVSTLRYIGVPVMLLTYLSPIFIEKIGVKKATSSLIITVGISLIAHLITIVVIPSKICLIISHLIYIGSLSMFVPTVLRQINNTSEAENRAIANSLNAVFLFIGTSIGGVLPTITSPTILIIIWSISFITIGYIIAIQNRDLEG